MTRKDKLLKRLLTKPSDFTWFELKSLLLSLGFSIVQGSGSRVKFWHEDSKTILSFHKPHPDNIVKLYIIK